MFAKEIYWETREVSSVCLEFLLDPSKKDQGHFCPLFQEAQCPDQGKAAPSKPHKSFQGKKSRTVKADQLFLTGLEKLSQNFLNDDTRGTHQREGPTGMGSESIFSFYL